MDSSHSPDADGRIDALAADLFRRAKRAPATLLAIGGVDTGKTTLVAQLAGILACAAPTAIVDADLGQSHIGPPTTVAWAMAEDGALGMNVTAARETFFVGSLSPPGNLLPLAVATISACRRARRQARIVLVDTPGFVQGDAAQALWWEIDRAVRPDRILAIEKKAELEPIIDGVDRAGKRTCRLPASSKAAPRTRAERAMFRAERFKAHFRGAVRQKICLKALSVQTRSRFGLAGRLMAVRGRNGVDLAVGVVEEWNSEEGYARFYGPEFDASRAHCVVVGEAAPEFGG